jgi:hypothetical protein
VAVHLVQPVLAVLVVVAAVVMAGLTTLQVVPAQLTLAVAVAVAVPLLLPLETLLVVLVVQALLF